ncbi:hypothetical protein CEXT_377621 [Caerostris extrusa]|uniref:Uncharacterized protein n=1 Tax=Caerostris extrusa TaxID=172846 RepID=A0AAV4NQE3_CAEEX|nr:hypothetical protein CEXT_377621 [Caerostris extrusa]
MVDLRLRNLCILKASKIYDDEGLDRTTGRQHLTLALFCEEQGYLTRALEEYQKAAYRFQEERSMSLKAKCLINVARISAIVGNYNRARRYSKVSARWLPKPMSWRTSPMSFSHQSRNLLFGWQSSRP